MRPGAVFAVLEVGASSQACLQGLLQAAALLGDLQLSLRGCSNSGMGEQGGSAGNPRILKTPRGVHFARIACGTNHSLALSSGGQVCIGCYASTH